MSTIAFAAPVLSRPQRILFTPELPNLQLPEGPLNTHLRNAVQKSNPYGVAWDTSPQTFFGDIALLPENRVGRFHLVRPSDDIPPEQVYHQAGVDRWFDPTLPNQATDTRFAMVATRNEVKNVN